MAGLDDIKKFNANLRSLYKRAPEVIESKKNREDVTAASGNNITFRNDLFDSLSNNYAKELKDAIRFYQKEFKVTPNATIKEDYDRQKFDWLTAPDGQAMVLPNGDGRRDVFLRRLYKASEPNTLRNLSESVDSGFHPKNSDKLGNIPFHELGHVLSGMFFPIEDTSSNRDIIKDSDYSGNYYRDRQLVKDALSDIGISKDNYKNHRDYSQAAEKKISEISEYATYEGSETVAEALVDYYYSRDNASDLSKAIVKRLKQKGNMYAINQTGGFDLGYPQKRPYNSASAFKEQNPKSTVSDNFVKNLRRYRVVQ